LSTLIRPRQQFRHIHRYVPLTEPVPYAVITGTVTDGVSMGSVALGGPTIIITLTNETWVAAGATFDAIRQDIIDDLDSAQAEAAGWNVEVRDTEDVSAVVRTSDTVVTITLSAAAGYVITADETITVTVPASAVVGGVAITATPTFSVTAPFTFEYTGTGGAIAGGEATVAVFNAINPGASTVDVYNPNGVLQGTLTPLRYRMSRYENQVGAWACDLPLDEDITATVPLAADIAYGWKISISQENFFPENNPANTTLLYQGIVEERDFKIDQGGNAYLALKGSFRTYALVRRSVFQNLEFDGALSTLANTLVSTHLDPYGLVYGAAAGTATIEGNFSDISRYEALIKAAKLGRHVVRETWDHDRPELVKYDGPPDSGLTFRPANDDEKGGSHAEYAARYAHDIGASGVGLISGTPTIRYDGSNLVNRIVAIGVDTIEDPDDPSATISSDLTLQHATFTSPYTVKAGINPDATFYYYIEDEDSIEAYGLTEIVLNFTEVKNPNDLLASRQQAANVLYMKAVNVLINRRSEKVEVTLNPIANGSRLWALPGDSAQVEYHGEVTTESGASVWMDMDKKFLITERYDESHPSGIRRVGYKLAAPEMEFPVPGLPGEISLPPEDGGPDDPGTPDGPSEEPCCEDPNTDESGGPDDDFEDNFPPAEAQSARYGRSPLVQAIAGGGVGGIPWNYKIDGDLDFGEPPITSFALPSLGAGTWSITVRMGIGQSPLWPTTTWTVAIKAGGVGGSTLASTSFVVEPGGSNVSETADGFPFFPTTGASFDAGTYSSITVTVSPDITSRATFGFGDDSYIQLSFTPA
jgi:hypothetical protein